MNRLALKVGAAICALSLSSAYAQTAIDNPYRNVASTDAVFTPDVAADLAGATRVRIELSFQGDAWRIESARQEAGVASSYPDQTGFVTAALANAGGERLVSVGVADPRIVRIYERVPETHTWTRESVRPLRRPLRELRNSRPEMHAHLPTLINVPTIEETPPQGPLPAPPEASGRIVNPAPPESTMRAPALRERTTRLNPAPQESMTQAPAPGEDLRATSAPQQGGARAAPGAPEGQAIAPAPPEPARMFRGDLSEAEMNQVLRTVPQFTRRGAAPVQSASSPPHMEAPVSEGRVVLYLPNVANACGVRVAIAAAAGAQTNITAPLRDFEGRPRCR